MCDMFELVARNSTDVARALFKKPYLVIKSHRNKPIVLFNVRILLHPIPVSVLFYTLQFCL